MTKTALKAYIQKDLRKIDGEIKKEKKRMEKMVIKEPLQPSTLLAHLISRKGTLREILSLL